MTVPAPATHRPPVHVSFACWPGLRHEQAAQHMSEEISEPLFGPLSTAHVQLVPQSFGILTEDLAEQLMTAFPQVRFRLHANVRVLPKHRVADLSGYQAHADWFRQAARISRRLSAPAYTAHSGLRSESTLPAMLDHARRCADLFGCPVGVEGLYPASGDPWLVSSWAEYRQLFESGVPYALDLSHLNILASASGVRDDTLVREMLACERCIEVRVSANDGRGDWHQVCEQAPWWHPLLASLHPQAAVFSEGNHRRKRPHPMSSTPPAPAADYRLGASVQIELSEEGEAVVRAFREAEAAFDALEPSWAGAYLASLFVRHPWLQALRITLWASAEYDDQGGSYRSIHNSVSTVKSIPGTGLPEDLTVDGHFDETAAISLIEADLDENDYCLYSAISDGADDWAEHALEVSRDAISELLACMPISGSLVYRAVCPPQDGHTAT